jgi:divalent metal cation (Fe/Co/Zn/Cd) transporter
MAVTSVEVIQYACLDLYKGFTGNIPEIQVGLTMYVVISVGIVLKFVLWIYCKAVNENNPSDILGALAEDHLNDVFSNTAAIITAAIAFEIKSVWFLDPVGAIVISAIIIARWSGMIMEQVNKVIGYTAPQEFLDQVNDLARQHDPRIQLDCTRAYHFGARFNVEMEIVLPADMTVRESHDIALELQHKVEGLEEVERCFVHVDHLTRDGLEHKIERQLVEAAKEIKGEPRTLGVLPYGIRLRLPVKQEEVQTI